MYVYKDKLKENAFKIQWNLILLLEIDVLVIRRIPSKSCDLSFTKLVKLAKIQQIFTSSELYEMSYVWQFFSLFPVFVLWNLYYYIKNIYFKVEYLF